MTRMIRRLILAAAVGLFAAGTASAQQPLPPAPVAYAPQAVQVQPKPLPGAPGAAPAVVVPGVPVAAPVAAPGQAGCCGSVAAPSNCGGCDSCGSKRYGLHSRLANSPATIGAGCANSVGCSTWSQQRTFTFGSCNQFFGAGNKCGGFGFGGCAHPPIGTGIGSCGPCVYGSYLNR